MEDSSGTRWTIFVRFVAVVKFLKAAPRIAWLNYEAHALQSAKSWLFGGHMTVGRSAFGSALVG